MKVKIIDCVLKQLVLKQQKYRKESSTKVWCLCLLIGVTILIPSEQLFAQTTPVVQSITRHEPVSSAVSDSSQVTFRVQFSQGVVNVDATDFDITGSVDASLSSVTRVNDSLYEVNLENIIGTGTLGLGVKGTGSIAGTNNIGSYNGSSGTELLTIEQDQANDFLNQSEIGQTFTATTSTVLHKITIYKNSGNHEYSGTATLTIYSGEYGGGSATSLTSEQVTFTSDAGAQNFEITNKPALELGEKYSFVFSGFSSSGYALDNDKNAAYSYGRAYFTGMDIEGSHGTNFDLKFQVYEQEGVFDEELSAASPGVSESYSVRSLDGLFSIPDSDQPFTFYPSGGVWEDGSDSTKVTFDFNPQLITGPVLSDTNGVYQFDIEVSYLNIFPGGTVSTGLVSIPTADELHNLGVYANEYGYSSISGNKLSDASEEAFGTSYEVGDRIRVRYDAPGQTLDFYLKEEGEPEFILQGSGHAFENVEPASGANLHLGVSVKCAGACTFKLFSGSAPEIEVLGPTQNLGEAEAGSGHTVQEYIIKNAGDVPLSLSGSPLVSISGADSADFSVIAQPLDTTIDADKVVIFTIRFAPATEGVKTATVTILSDDEDEGTYTFDITGTAIPPNTPPVATGVTVSGVMETGETLSGTYTYYDEDSDSETGTTFAWYRSTDALGSNKTAISGATSQSYELNIQDVGSYISFSVTPHDGEDSGAEVESTRRYVNPAGSMQSIPDSDQPFTFYPSGGVWENESSTLTFPFGFNPILLKGPELVDTTGIYQFDIEIINFATFSPWGYSIGLVSVPIADSLHNVGDYANEYGYSSISGNKLSDATEEAFGTSYEAGDRIRVRYDAPDQTLDFYLKQEGESEFILQGSGHAFENVVPDSGKTLSLGASLQCNGTCMLELLSTPEPEIDILGSTLNFGGAEAGTGQLDQEYVIKNSGDDLLTLSGSPVVAISGTGSADFSVITPPEHTISAGDSTTFVIRFAPVTTGLKTATVTILSDDEDEGTYTFEVIGTGIKSAATIAGDEGWRLLSSPVSGVSLGTMLDTLWTQGFTGADTENGSSNVYVWDAENGQWEIPSDTGFVPAAGTGFAVYVYGDDDYTLSEDSVGFPKRLFINAPGNSGNVQPNLFYNSSGTPANDGWNLLGNPYSTTIDWDAEQGWTTTNIDASIYVWSDSAGGGNGQYLTWNGSTGTLPDGIIAPWQGFWVKTNADDPGITFSEQVQSSGGVLYKSVAPSRKVPTPEIQFIVEGAGVSSKAILMMSEDADPGTDRWDAYKLQSLNQESLSLYTQSEDGSALDINALPVEFGETIDIPLDFEISTSEEIQEIPLRLDWSLEDLPEGLNAWLTDNETGEVINLTESAGYEFSVGDRQKIAGKTQNLGRLQHEVVSPAVLKAKSPDSGVTPRFTLTLSYKTLVTNELTAALPETFGLDQNYPNPFNPSTEIKYQLPQNSAVSLKVFDLLGREVATLIDGQIEAGYHQVTFNARNLASGMYIYRLQAGAAVITKKLTLIK